MAVQPFERMVEGADPLLAMAEGVVVDAHRRWRQDLLNETWTVASAYRWLHFEDPEPVRRLIDGVDRLAALVEVDQDALRQLLAGAAVRGYPATGSSGHGRHGPRDRTEIKRRRRYGESDRGKNPPENQK